MALTCFNISLTFINVYFLPFRVFSENLFFLLKWEYSPPKNKEQWMKCLKAETCFSGWMWIEWRTDIWQGCCSCNVFASLNISKEIESPHLILERWQWLGKKTLEGFRKTHSIGQLNANCKTHRLTLIHFACLEESLKPLKIQRGSYI